jgi:hypothetical protein
MPATRPPLRAAAVAVLVGVEVLILLRSERLGVTLLAFTAILLLTAYTFRPSRPPPPPGPDPGWPNRDN